MIDLSLTMIALGLAFVAFIGMINAFFAFRELWSIVVRMRSMPRNYPVGESQRLAPEAIEVRLRAFKSMLLAWLAVALGVVVVLIRNYFR